MSSQEISIKQLPLIDEINTGDLLVVQTPNATSTLDFDNFVIGLENTSFSPTISAHTADINALSTTFDNTFFKPTGLITGTGLRFALSGDDASFVRDQTVVTNVDNQTFTTTTVSVSGTNTGSPVAVIDNITGTRAPAASATITQEDLRVFQPSYLPINITEGGTTTRYYFILSGAYTL